MSVLPNISYYLGSYRRTRCDLTQLPQALGFEHNKVCLVNFDAASLVSFTPHNEGYLVNLVDDEIFLGEFSLLPHSPFRNGPGDVSFKMVEKSEGKLLCSEEKTGRVFYAHETDVVINVNIAWEATPDIPGDELGP